MAKLWSGDWPSNRAPTIEPIETDVALQRVRGGVEHRAHVRATDPDGDSLRYHWEIRAESSDRRAGGDHEWKPEVHTIFDETGGSLTFVTPKQSGEYRLFVFVFDDEGNVATANVPFAVK